MIGVMRLLTLKQQESSLISLVGTRKRNVVGEFILLLKVWVIMEESRRIKDSLNLMLPEPITKEWRRGLTTFFLTLIFYFLIYIKHRVVLFGYAGRVFSCRKLDTIVCPTSEHMTQIN
jgi:hypothetical protein